RPWPASASTASGTTPPWWKSRGSPSCSWSGGAAHSRLPGGFHVGVGLVGQGVPQGEEQVGGAGAVPVLREHLGGQAGVEERQPAPDGEGADVVDERLRVGSGALPAPLGQQRGMVVEELVVEALQLAEVPPGRHLLPDVTEGQV